MCHNATITWFQVGLLSCWNSRYFGVQISLYYHQKIQLAPMKTTDQRTMTVMSTTWLEINCVLRSRQLWRFPEYTALMLVNVTKVFSQLFESCARIRTWKRWTLCCGSCCPTSETRKETKPAAPAKRRRKRRSSLVGSDEPSAVEVAALPVKQGWKRKPVMPRRQRQPQSTTINLQIQKMLLQLQT